MRKLTGVSLEMPNLFFKALGLQPPLTPPLDCPAAWPHSSSALEAFDGLNASVFMIYVCQFKQAENKFTKSRKVVSISSMQSCLARALREAQY